MTAPPRDCGMVEIEVYAKGLRAPDKLLGLDLELGAVPGLRYKVDAPHDIIFLESDDPAISLEAIAGIFRKLDLQARFVGQTHSVAQTLTATQVIGL
ncbi:MAG: hypothetical protein RIQ71_1900 [Verrucomicrobiota bacterium]